MGDSKDSNNRDAWSRPIVNLRLSRRRLSQLRTVGGKLSPSATPSEVIDLALACALSPDRETKDRLDDIEDAQERSNMERRVEFDRLEAAIDGLARRIEELHRAMIDAIESAED